VGLSSADVENVEFGTSRRGGYDRTEVTRFLARVAKTLAALESDMAVSRRLNRDYDDRLKTALREAEGSSDSFLLAADLKQKLLTEAEERAAEILSAAHAAVATPDVEAAVQADLDVLQRRSDTGEDSGSDDRVPAASVGEAGGEEPGESIRAASERKDAEDLLLAARAEVAAARGESDALKREAQETLDQAVHAVAEARAEVESILQAAREEAGRITEEAVSTADALLKSAEADAAGLVAKAETDAAEQRKDAAAESARMLRSARLEAEGVLESAQVRHRDALTRLRELEQRIADIEAVAPRFEAGAADEPDIVVLLEETHELSQDLAADITLRDEESGADPATKETRYSRRSARLPSLGKDANRVLADMGSLRTSEPESRTRRRK
jgi:DivIVA domain-containing protein